MASEDVIRGNREHEVYDEADEVFDPELMRIVRKGIDIEAWLKSAAGVHVYNKAINEIRQSTAIIADANSLDDEGAVSAHEHIKLIRKLLEWFNEALEEGNNAQQQLENQYGEVQEIDESGGLPSEY